MHSLEAYVRRRKLSGKEWDGADASARGEACVAYPEVEFRTVWLTAADGLPGKCGRPGQGLKSLVGPPSAKYLLRRCSGPAMKLRRKASIAGATRHWRGFPNRYSS